MKYLLTIPVFLLATVCFAQVKRVRQNIYFLKNDGEQVLTKDSADFIRIVREPDISSKLYNVQEYYLDAKRKMVGQSSTIDPIVLEGRCINYWPNGHIKQVATYKANVMEGVVFKYYSNGKASAVLEYSIPDTSKINGVPKPQTILVKTYNDSTGKEMVINSNGHYTGYANVPDNYLAHGTEQEEIFEEGNIKDGKHIGTWTGHFKKLNFIENYEDNHLISGKATDSISTYSYNERVVYPQYDGGINAFYSYLTHTLNYPKAAREGNIQGKVFIQFTINTDGSVKNIIILRCPSIELGLECTNVISHTKNWVPGTLFGRKEDMLYVIPINFSFSFKNN